MSFIHILKILKKIKLLCLPFLFLGIFSAHANVIMTFSQQKQHIHTALLTVSVLNDSNQTVQLLKWNTPFENIVSGDIFNIHNAHMRMKYIGRVVKRLHPIKSDYMILQAGERRSVTVDLSRYYKMQNEGKYSIGYKGWMKTFSLDAKQEINHFFSKASTPSLTILFKPAKVQKKTSKRSHNAAKKTAAFNACTYTQINTLNAAHNEAIAMAEESTAIMNNASEMTQGKRYTTWFGVPNSNRQSTVTSHYNKIYSALDNQDIGFDCSCNENYYAYVYNSEPYTIYLCNAFWYAPRTGTDSQAGTLIHEMSHFTVVAGTEDYAYGHTDAKNLAKNNPNNAVFNADNHEYFAENNPYLTMESQIQNTLKWAPIIMGDIVIFVPSEY